MYRKDSVVVGEWIKNSNKALLITGARQIGKTWLIRDEISKSSNVFRLFSSDIGLLTSAYPAETKVELINKNGEVNNVALNMGGVRGETFLAVLHEMPIMVPAAFILEFFVVGKLARRLAFTVMRPDDRPQFITYAISICICCIMCPTMSLIATILFKDTKDFGTWIQTWAMNFPMAILYQMFYCGPLVRFIFLIIF